MHKVRDNILKDFKKVKKLDKWFHKNFELLNIEDELDKIIILELNIDNLKKDDMMIEYNEPILNKFPNALLLVDTPEKKNEIITVKEEQKGENIWDMLENVSETLENITTESEEKCKVEKKCIGCGNIGNLFEESDSAIICSQCGMINEELLSHGPEWRHYNNEDSRGEGMNRCGAPTNYFFPKSSQGTFISGTNSSRLQRKQKWNCMIYKEKSLNLVFETITSICSKNGIPKIIIDDAKIFYKIFSDCVHKKGDNIGKPIIIRGINRKSIIAACVFKACEQNKNPRSVKEIAKMFSLDEKKLTKGNKQFDLNMKSINNEIGLFDTHKETDTAEDYIRRHCPKLHISQEHTDIAINIAYNCSRIKLASDHNPQSVAAGSILVMVIYCNLAIDKKDIALLFGTSDVTIGKIFNKIYPFVDVLVNNDATDHIIKVFKING